ncbi:MAG TPA: Ig-like domain-containing protein [Gemmatimonadales bacterium]|nr:Ig-like domain-containing protein [Gemmatimonadales bacterium]
MPRRVSALVATVLVAAGSLTCGESAGPDPNAVARVVITPDTSTIDTGDSLQLSAVARNAAGDELSGKSFAWSSLDAALASVTSSGRVRARWPGVARIVATSDQRSDTARFAIRAKITSLTVTPALDTLTAFGATVAVTVHASIGSQGYADGSYTWELTDTTVARLLPYYGPDSVRTVQGWKNGTTVLRIREAGGAVDSARIVVRQRPKNIYFAQQFRAYRACPLRLLVVLTDSLNFPVTNDIVMWSLSDTALARIDSTGLVTPLATGSDTVVVQAGSLSRRAALTIVAAPTVTLQTFGVVSAVTTVGLGQYAVAKASLAGGSNEAPARFSVVSSDTSTLAVPYDSTVPMGWLDLALLHLVGRRTGAVTLTPYLCDVPGPPVSFTVTRPKLGLAGDVVTTARIDDPPVVLNIQTRDSTGAWQHVADPVVVRVTGTDTTVLRPDSAYHHIPADSASSYVFFTYPDSGSTRLVIRDSAGLYIPDSTAVIHVAYPPIYFADHLSLSTDTLRLAMRQRLYPPNQPYQHHHVVLDRYVVGAAIPIHLSTSDSMTARVSPDSVTVPVGVSGAPMDIAGGDVRGVATLTARASRHRDGHLVVKTDRPAVSFYNFGSGEYPGDSMRVELFAYDSATFVRGYPTENVTFTLSVGDTSVVSIDSTTLTIPAGAETSAVAWAHLKGLGTATVTVRDPRAAPYAYAPATTPPVTVVAPYLATQESTVSLGTRLNWALFVVVNGPYRGGLVVHVRQSNPAVLSLSDTAITIGAYPNNGSVVTTGAASGVDTVVVSAAGFKPDTTIITVGPATIGIPQWPTSMAVGDSFPLFLQTEAPDGTGRFTADTVVITLAPNSDIEFHLDGAVISTLTIPAGQYMSPFFYVKAKAAGTGTVTITAPNYTPVTQSVSISP